MRRKFTVGQCLLCAVFLLLIVSMLVPVLNLVARAFAGKEGSLAMRGYSIWPKQPTLKNFQIVFSNPVILPSLWNNVFIAVVGTMINMLVTTMAAYAVTRPRLLGKQFFMVFFIIMMLFNPGLVPEYMVIRNLKLMDTFWSVLLVSAVNVYYLFILMRFFEEVPETILEAARIDGAGHMRVLFSIMLPLAKVGIATIAMFYAVARWNEYFRPGIYLLSTSKTTLQVMIRKFVVQGDLTDLLGYSNMMNRTDAVDVNYNALKSAAVVVGVLPILAIYPLVLKFYAKDVMVGGVKE